MNQIQKFPFWLINCACQVTKISTKKYQDQLFTYLIREELCRCEILLCLDARARPPRERYKNV